MSEIKFNINNWVKVKLHPEAKEYYRNLHDYHWWSGDVKEDEEGYSRWQMWSLMETFGHFISLGNKHGFPFSTDIILVLPQKEEEYGS